MKTRSLDRQRLVPQPPNFLPFFFGVDCVLSPSLIWTAQYHDMGLIGSVLALLFCGGSGYYMSPASFIKRPALWVELMSRYRATHMQVRYSFVSSPWGDYVYAWPWCEAFLQLYGLPEGAGIDRLGDVFAVLAPTAVRRRCGAWLCSHLTCGFEVIRYGLVGSWTKAGRSNPPPGCAWK